MCVSCQQVMNEQGTNNGLLFCSQECENQWADENFDLEPYYGNNTLIIDEDLYCGGEPVGYAEYCQGCGMPNCGGTCTADREFLAQYAYDCV